jgi:hypothetical protein
MVSWIAGKVKRIEPRQWKWIVVFAVIAVWAMTLVKEALTLAIRLNSAHEVAIHPWQFIGQVLPLLCVAAVLNGILGLLAILMMYMPKPKTAAGRVLIGVMVSVLIVAPFFGVSFLFVAVAAPFLYTAAVVTLSSTEKMRKKREEQIPESGEKAEAVSSSQWTLIALIVAFAVGGVLYRLLIRHQLGHSAAMFLGIPAVIAILLALTPKAKSLTGGIVKGITLALLIIAPLLGEGYLCILFASPLFYLVGIAVGVLVDWSRHRRNATLSCVALVLLPMSLEGVIPALSFNRNQTVEASSVVNAGADVVEGDLALSPNLTTGLPAALRIGFPRPLEAWGAGLEIGATRTIHFASPPCVAGRRATRSSSRGRAPRRRPPSTGSRPGER